MFININYHAHVAFLNFMNKIWQYILSRIIGAFPVCSQLWWNIDVGFSPRLLKIDPWNFCHDDDGNLHWFKKSKTEMTAGIQGNKSKHTRLIDLAWFFQFHKYQFWLPWPVFRVRLGEWTIYENCLFQFLMWVDWAFAVLIENQCCQVILSNGLNFAISYGTGISFYYAIKYKYNYIVFLICNFFF